MYCQQQMVLGFFIYENQYLEAEELAQGLRAFVTLTKDPGLIPSPHLEVHHHL